MTAELPEAVFALWAARVESGEAVDFDELVRHHAGIADALRQLHEEWRLFAPLLERVVPGRIASAEGAAPGDSGAGEAEPDLETRVLLERLGIRAPNHGRYRFRGVVGHGGGGVVLKVWDTKLARPLAMKIVLGRGATPTGDTPQVDGRTVTRFVDEARIASQLDHPGIVPVHEIGADESGRAFFTMKLVRGEDLATVFARVRARRDGWSETRAVGVLLKVCEALAFAHERGVVHRDLKPSNVMVGRHGEVYVMDWGLARVVSARKGETGGVDSIRGAERATRPGSPWLTLDGSAVGTPAYMSPEQARGDVEEIDARSDIYAVGALLYELLAGSAPYLESRPDATALDVVLAVIDGPPTRIERLAPRAPVELASICERAMQRAKERRYASAAELADDLRAYLERRVVAAHATGTWAETRKWVQRNSRLAGALGAVVAISVASAIALYAQTSRATEAANRAEISAAEAKVSEQNAARGEAAAKAGRLRAQRVTNMFLTSLSGADPYQDGAVDLRVSDAMEVARRELESGILADEPDVEAQVQMSLARVLNGVGRSRDALPLAERALATLVATGAHDTTDLIEARDGVAMSLFLLGRFAEALPHYRAVLDMNVRRHLGMHVVVASALTNLSRCVQALGGREEALALDERALDLVRKFKNVDCQEHVAALTNLGTSLGQFERHEEALPLHEAALAMARRLEPGDHHLVVSCLNNLAATLSSIGRSASALPMLQEALAMYRRIQPRDHPTVATNLTNTGYCLVRLARGDEALPMYWEALQVRRRMYAEESAQLARSIYSLGHCRRTVGCVGDALGDFQAALAMLRRVAPGDEESEALFVNNLATALLSSGRFADALPQCERALVLHERRADGDAHDSAISLNNLAFCLEFLDRHEEALARFEAAAAMYQRVLPPEHSDVRYGVENVARRLLAAGRLDEALGNAELFALLVEEHAPPDDPDRLSSQTLLADARARVAAARAR